MKNYQKLALRTDHKSYDHVSARFTPSMSRLTHAALGLSTEANEFADQLKKHLIYGKELDKINLIEELGDILFFVNLACDELKISIETAMEVNLVKLKKRYASEFTQEEALFRDTDSEKEAMSQILGDVKKTLG